MAICGEYTNLRVFKCKIASTMHSVGLLLNVIGSCGFVFNSCNCDNKLTDCDRFDSMHTARNHELHNMLILLSIIEALLRCNVCIEICRIINLI